MQWLSRLMTLLCCKHGMTQSIWTPVSRVSSSFLITRFPSISHLYPSVSPSSQLHPFHTLFSHFSSSNTCSTILHHPLLLDFDVLRHREILVGQGAMRCVRQKCCRALLTKNHKTVNVGTGISDKGSTFCIRSSTSSKIIFFALV